MRYRLELSRTALRGLEQLPPQMRERLTAHLSGLTTDPRPLHSRHLQGHLTGFRRLRVGDYRAIYQVDDEQQCVTVVRVGPRSSVYK